MLRHATAAATLAIVMTATTARATVISGTWSFEVDAWAVPFPFIPPPPVIGSATFSFDNSTTSPTGIPLPNSDFTSNFGATLASYFYDPAFDTLKINFAGAPGPSFIIQAQFIDVSTHFIEPSVPPILHDVLFMPSLDVQIAASSFSGSFAPTPAVPEPSTWAMMLLGFAGLGFAFRQSRRKVSFA
jgi:hypothetical protein